MMALELKPGITLYFARHGETLANVEKRFQGRNDTPLTEHGRLQARMLASGHLSMPSPPLPEFFETPHVLVVPREHVATVRAIADSIMPIATAKTAIPTSIAKPSSQKAPLRNGTTRPTSRLPRIHSFSAAA